MKCIANKFFKNIGKINSAPTAPETEDKCDSFEEFMDSDEDTCDCSNCFEEFMSSDDSIIVDAEPDIITDSEPETVIIEDPEAVIDTTPEADVIVSNLPASSKKEYDVCKNVLISYRVPCKTCGEKFKNGDIIRFDSDGSIHHADCKFIFGDPLFVIDNNCKDGIFETDMDVTTRKALNMTTAVMQNDVTIGAMENYLGAYDKYLTDYVSPDKSNLVNDNGLYQKKQNAKKRKRKKEAKNIDK